MKEEILKITLKYEEAVKGIAQYKDKIDELKVKEKALSNQLLDGGITRTKYNEETAKTKILTKEYGDAIRVLEKNIHNSEKAENSKTGSLVALRAELSNVTAQYDAMSEADRKAAKGLELKNKINELTNATKEGEEGTQRFYRNVGNYEEAAKGLETEIRGLSKQMAYMKTVGEDNTGEYQRMAQRAGELRDAIGDAKQEINNLASDTGTLDSVLGGASAVSGGFGAATGAMQMLGASSESVEEAQKKLQATIAITTGIQAVQNNLQKQSALMLGVVKLQTLAAAKSEAIKTAATASGTTATIGATVAQRIFNAVAKANPYVLLAMALVTVVGALVAFSEGTKDSAKEQAKLNKVIEDSSDALGRMEREVDLDVAIAKASGKSVNEIRKIEYAALQSRESLAYTTLCAIRDSKKATKEQVDAAEEMYKKSTSSLQLYFDKIRVEDTQSKTDANKRMIEDAKKATGDAKELAKIRKNTELELTQQLEDGLNEIIKNEADKQSAIIETQYTREIEALKKKLNDDKTLTEVSKNTINKLILSKEIQKQNALDALSAENIQKQIAVEQQRIELMLSAVSKGSVDEYNLKIAALSKQKEAELYAVDATEQDKLLIREKYRMLEDELYASHTETVRQEQADAMRLDFENKIAEMQLSGENTLQLKLEQRAAELDALQQMEGESDAAFKARQLEAEQEYVDAKKELADQENDIQQSKFDAASKITNSLVGLTAEIGESNKGFAIASKMLALAEIGINTGKAIAAGVAQAQSVPFPGNLAAIATTVATVIANVTTAIKTVKSVKLATGGVVSGEGSGTSDSVPAMLSNGESVLTAQATSMFGPILSSLNLMGGGIPINVVERSNQIIGEDMLARAFARGISAMPSPVVSVEEITSVINRVQVLENLGKA